VGELVGQRYRIDRLIGEDALGWIYGVSETSTPAASDSGPAALALRLLRIRLGAGGIALPSEVQKVWRSQLGLLRDLRHPGVVPVHEVCLGDEQGRVYVVRAAVETEGQPLYALLQTRPGGLPEAEAVRLCAAIAEAVEAAHQHGVLHLCLSPQRIFLLSSGETFVVKVADFALVPPPLSARYCEPGYLSPEQAEGQPCDRRTDQFSLAVIFYEMLSGQPAFIGAPDEDRATILARVVSEDPLPLALSRPIELALARALSRSRPVRFPGLSDFVCALGVDGVAWTAVRVPGPARSQLSPLPSRRRPLYIPVFFGAVLAIAVLGLSSLLTGWPWFRHGAPSVPGSGAPSDVAKRAALPSQVAAPKSPAQGPAQEPWKGLAVTSPPDLAPPVAAGRQTGMFLSPAQGLMPPLRGAPVSPVKTSASGGSPSTNPTPSSGQTAPAPTPATTTVDTDLRVTSPGAQLSPHNIERIKYCLSLIHARPPFTVVLENINGTLYVADRTSSAEIKLSNDFRNCLKNEVRGNIDLRDVYIKGIPRGKVTP
jgi:serine/threonine-protein kinase